MRKRFLASVLVAVLCTLRGAAPAVADDYTVDSVHSSVSFKASHIGLSWVHGRFNEFAGTFTINPESAAKSSFVLNIKAESVDTNNSKRDEHLRGPDYFNVKQFPALSFKSTAVEAVKGGLQVTGDLTLHGVTKPVTFVMIGGGKAEFPKGVQRTGYSTELKIKRSEYGMDKALEGIGDEVLISISLEGTKK